VALRAIEKEGLPDGGVFAADSSPILRLILRLDNFEGTGY
jgi:hypothetical protein